jgi:hypothetical protein
MEKYSNSGHHTSHFAKLGQQPNNWAQLMPRFPPLNPQFKLSKKILRPLLNLIEYQYSKSWTRPCSHASQYSVSFRVTYMTWASSKLRIGNAGVNCGKFLSRKLSLAQISVTPSGLPPDDSHSFKSREGATWLPAILEHQFYCMPLFFTTVHKPRGTCILYRLLLNAAECWWFRDKPKGKEKEK